MSISRTIPLALLLVVGCGSAVPSKETNLAVALATAPAGRTLKLPARDYGDVSLRNLQRATPLVVDASAATFRGLTLNNVRGLKIIGARVIGDFERNIVVVSKSRQVELRDFKISDAKRGILIDRSTDVVLANNILSGLRIDGIAVALSQRVIVEGNTCRDFKPRESRYDSGGSKIVEGDHPDCIQAWSRPEAMPTADITVRGNQAIGRMQGIFFGNHVRGGVDDGGFDRILIEQNDLVVSYPQGLALYDARSSIVRNNRISTVPGAVMPGRSTAVRATVNIIRGNVRACGNRIEAFPAHPSAAPC